MIIYSATIRVHMRGPLPFLACCIRNTCSRKCFTTFRVVARQFAASDTETCLSQHITSLYIIISYQRNLFRVINEKDVRVLKIKEDWQITQEAFEKFSVNFTS